mgnify:FL=1|tara:strand:- start:141 stop:602 length:462 start_codon:yes stop_codon:yes gene_type:complete
MAHFAELDNENKVIRVVVISNEDVDANGGDLHPDAETFVATIVPHLENGVAWKQTSYNNNFRKQYCGKGFIYDATKDKFIVLQPFSSWSLDSNDDWQPPVTFPNTVDIGGLRANATWDEDNQRWIGKTFDHATDPVTETPYVWDATNLQWNED